MKKNGNNSPSRRSPRNGNGKPGSAPKNGNGNKTELNVPGLVLNSPALREIRARNAKGKFKKQLTALGLGSLLLMGAGTWAAYEPGVQVKQYTPWKNVPLPPRPIFFNPTNARKEYEALKKRIGNGMEYEYETRMFLNGPRNIPVKYRYKTNVHVPSKMPWPKGINIGRGGQVSSTVLCGMLTTALGQQWLQNANRTLKGGLISAAQAAVVCSILHARHYEPAQYLGFQLIIVNFIASCALWYWKDYSIQKQLDDENKEIKRLKEDFSLKTNALAQKALARAASAATNSAAAAARAANTAEAQLIQGAANAASARQTSRQIAANTAARQNAQHLNWQRAKAFELAQQERALALQEQVAAQGRLAMLLEHREVLLQLQDAHRGNGPDYNTQLLGAIQRVAAANTAVQGARQRMTALQAPPPPPVAMLQGPRAWNLPLIQAPSLSPAVNRAAIRRKFLQGLNTRRTRGNRFAAVVRQAVAKNKQTRSSSAGRTVLGPPTVPVPRRRPGESNANYTARVRQVARSSAARPKAKKN